MKTKIVLWGENENDEKILLGIELVEAENIIRIHTTPEAEATEIFYNQMMNQWREGQPIPMPESTVVLDRPLSMTEGLLPDNIKTQRQDILARAKTEWHFVILSSKLYESYVDEVGQMKERIAELTDFDSAIWEEAKAFWKKVQNQVQEKNLFREHAVVLRTKTNELFDNLKSLKASMNDEFERASKEQVDIFSKRLQEIEDRIEKGLGLQPIFNELKNIQNSFKDVKFTRKHHNDVWKRIDGAFKKVKEKRFGSRESGDNTASSRLTRRLEGLVSAINKMEQSISRDVRDKQFQEKRINTTDGQLELQIRQAKMAMIIERINSKQLKLDDMLKTKGELEKRLESEKTKEAKRKEKREQAKELKKAKSDAKAEIANEIGSKTDKLKEKKDHLEKAADKIKSSKSKTPPVSNDKPIETGANPSQLITEKEDASTPVKTDSVTTKTTSESENTTSEPVQESIPTDQAKESTQIDSEASTLNKAEQITPEKTDEANPEKAEETIEKVDGPSPNISEETKAGLSNVTKLQVEEKKSSSIEEDLPNENIADVATTTESKQTTEVFEEIKEMGEETNEEE